MKVGATKSTHQPHLRTITSFDNIHYTFGFVSDFKIISLYVILLIVNSHAITWWRRLRGIGDESDCLKRVPVRAHFVMLCDIGSSFGNVK